MQAMGTITYTWVTRLLVIVVNLSIRAEQASDEIEPIKLAPMVRCTFDLGSDTSKDVIIFNNSVARITV